MRLNSEDIINRTDYPIELRYTFYEIVDVIGEAFESAGCMYEEMKNVKVLFKDVNDLVNYNSVFDLSKDMLKNMIDDGRLERELFKRIALDMEVASFESDTSIIKNDEVTDAQYELLCVNEGFNKLGIKDGHRVLIIKPEIGMRINRFTKDKLRLIVTFAMDFVEDTDERVS